MKKFVRFEYDVNYFGERYSYGGVGSFAYVPLELVDKSSPESAFQQFTKIEPCHIVYYTLDELYDSKGNLIEEDDEDTELKIETGKTFIDSCNSKVFIVGKTSDGYWLGEILGGSFAKFDENGRQSVNFYLVKEYVEPIEKSAVVRLWRNVDDNETFLSIGQPDDRMESTPHCVIIGSKSIIVKEGEFSSDETKK